MSNKDEKIKQSYFKVIDAAEFLCVRLEEFERNLEDDEVGRDYYGHVHPAFSRLLASISEATNGDLK